MQFELFPKLPPEIRDAIWKSTVEPRAITVFATSRGKYPISRRPTIRIFDTAKTPIIFFISSESRKVAEKEHIRL